jgi:thioredoxin-related protein
MNGDEIGRDHPLAKVLGGRALPRAVLISRDGETVRSLEGKISASKLFSAMTQIVRGETKRDLGKFTNDMRKLLNDLEEIARDRQQLERKTAKTLEKGPNPAQARELQRDQEELEKKRAEIAKRMEELLAQTLPEKEEQAAKND